MAIRKNTRFIDPRYFMDEKTERSSTIELTEGLFNRMFGGDKEEEEESGSSGYALSPGSTGGPTMKLTRSGMDYIKGLVKTDPRTARALVTILSPETADQYGISQEERDELRKHLTYTDRLEYMNNM